MDPLRATLAIHECDDPPGVLRALAEASPPQTAPRCLIWVDAEANLVGREPSDAEIPSELLSMAAHVTQAEMFPLGTLSPVAAARYPSAELLLLPVEVEREPQGALLVIGERGAFGEELEAWEPVCAALARLTARHRHGQQLQTECESLRRRTQEMEALDVLGLAVNRTLDPEEVLTLVARFTRTLLGAHYATVNTQAEDERLHASATVGLRRTDDGCEPHDDPFAARVVEAGKPIVLGEGGEAFDAERYPLHAAQEMHTGLGVPLSLFGDTFGALLVGYRDVYPVTARDTMLALTLARHAAVAINNSRLHQQVAARSQELEIAYAKLSEMSAAKERFFASINHELRNPIGAVTGYQSMILDGMAGEVPDQVRTYLVKAQRAAGTLRTLVDDLLDLGKLAAGRMEVHIDVHPLDALFEEAVATLEPLARQGGVALQVEPAEGMLVRADRARLCQILVNLLSNAVKFTPEGGEVRLDAVWHAARREEDPRPGVVDIRVADSGPGIPEADRDRIFEEYAQVQGTKGGTGLGLPISRRLARLMEGDLRVESTVGAGSTFVIEVPGEALEQVSAESESGSSASAGAA